MAVARSEFVLLPVGSGRVGSGRVGSDRIGSGRVESGRVGAAGPGQAVWSRFNQAATERRVRCPAIDAVARAEEAGPAGAMAPAVGGLRIPCGDGKRPVWGLPSRCRAQDEPRVASRRDAVETGRAPMGSNGPIPWESGVGSMRPAPSRCTLVPGSARRGLCDQANRSGCGRGGPVPSRCTPLLELPFPPSRWMPHWPQVPPQRRSRARFGRFVLVGARKAEPSSKSSFVFTSFRCRRGWSAINAVSGRWSSRPHCRDLADTVSMAGVDVPPSPAPPLSRGA